MAGLAARFDAATDRISVSGTPPDPTSGITIAGWVYVVAANGEGNQTFARVHAASGASTSITFATAGNPPSGPGYFTAGGSITSSTQAPVGEWRMVAITCIGTTGALYAAAPGGATDVDTGAVAGAASPTGITLGGRSPVDGSEWLNGRLAYWRVWAAVLTQSEIEAEWASTTHLRTAGLWADWPLDGDILDHSGNGRHLTPGSTAVSYEAGPPVAEPVAGSVALTAVAALAAVGAKTTAGRTTFAATAAAAGAGVKVAPVSTPLPAGAGLAVAGATRRSGTVSLKAVSLLTAGPPPAAHDIILTASLAPQTRHTAGLASPRWTTTLGAQP